MPSIIDSISTNIHAIPTPESLKPGAEHINAERVGPAAVRNVGNNGYSPVESAQRSAEQSYSAMAAATAGGGQDLTVEIMLEQNGKNLA